MPTPFGVPALLGGKALEIRGHLEPHCMMKGLAHSWDLITLAKGFKSDVACPSILVTVS